MLKTVAISGSGTNGTVTQINAGTGINVSPSPITGNGTVSLANTTVTAGTYGNASINGIFTVDAQGRLTSASNVAIAIANTAITGGNITLGNTTVGLGNTATSLGNITLANVTIPSGTMNVTIINSTSNISSNATFSSATMMLTPANYLIVNLNGVNVKIPYYSV